MTGAQGIFSRATPMNVFSDTVLDLHALQRVGDLLHGFVGRHVTDVERDHVLLDVHALRREGITEQLVLHVRCAAGDDQRALGAKEVSQEAVAVLLAQLRMDHPELDRQLHPHLVDEVPDVELLKAGALAGANAHHEAGALHLHLMSSFCQGRTLPEPGWLLGHYHDFPSCPPSESRCPFGAPPFSAKACLTVTHGPWPWADSPERLRWRGPDALYKRLLIIGHAVHGLKCILSDGSLGSRRGWCCETGDQRRRREVTEEPFVVVGHASELHEARALTQLGWVDECVAHAPIAVLGTPATADVDECGLADLPSVRDVRVPEEDRRVRVLTCHALHRGDRTVLEQVLVDATRTSMNGKDLALRSLQNEVVLERSQVGLHLVRDDVLRPGEGCGALGALLVGLVHAAAVAGLEADALVVVAHQRWDAAVAHEKRDLVR